MGKKLLALLLTLLIVLIVVFALTSNSAKAPETETITATIAESTAATLPPSSSAQEPQISFSVIKSDKPKYVFLMIGDGMGKAQRQLAESYLEQTGSIKQLIINTFPIAGEMTTNSLNATVTDSAASATALATGHKTNNGMLSVSPDGNKLDTVMELAKEKLGMATGLVTTTRITNATPAAFAAHQESRSDEDIIALDYLNSGVDFFAGGGAQHFLPTSYSGGDDAAGEPLLSVREDEADLVLDFRAEGYRAFIGAEGAQNFSEYSPAAGDKVLAPLTNSNMPWEIDKLNDSGISAPGLADMTRKAVDTLELDEDGFILMVEGGRIDHACHINDTAGTIFETLAFDDAVDVAYDFYLEHPDETLVIVTADHETGGLELALFGLNFSCITNVKISVQHKLQQAYEGDRDLYYEYIAENLGLDDLNLSERASLEAAFDSADSGISGKEYGGYSPPAIAASGIISDRAGVIWETFSHTGIPVPISAIGVKSKEFEGKIDNAKVGQLILHILGL